MTAGIPPSPGRAVRLQTAFREPAADMKPASVPPSGPGHSYGSAASIGPLRRARGPGVPATTRDRRAGRSLGFPSLAGASTLVSRPAGVAAATGRHRDPDAAEQRGPDEDLHRLRALLLLLRLRWRRGLLNDDRLRSGPAPTDLGTDLHRIVSELYRGLPGATRRVRLLGVQAGGLVSAGAQQLALLQSGPWHPERWDEVERTVDRIEHRFGPGAAGPASLLRRTPRR